MIFDVLDELEARLASGTYTIPVVVRQSPKGIETLKLAGGDAVEVILFPGTAEAEHLTRDNAAAANRYTVGILVWAVESEVDRRDFSAVLEEIKLRAGLHLDTYDAERVEPDAYLDVDRLATQGVMAGLFRATYVDYVRIQT